MTIKTISDALTAVHTLAKDGNFDALGPSDLDAEQQANLRQNAIDTFGDLLDNNWEGIDDDFEQKGGIGSLYTSGGEFPEMRTEAVRDLLLDLGQDDMLLVLQLAEERVSNLPDDETVVIHDEDGNESKVDVDDAMRASLAFIATHGEEFFGTQLTSIALPEGFFEKQHG